MKKLMTILMSSLCLLGFVLTLNAAAEEVSYYVCFLEENYTIKNKNKMELSEEGLYVLENKSLSRANSFYVSSNTGERYYAKNNQEMRVDRTDSFSYTIYFSRDSIFDLEHIQDGMLDTDCHITYALYSKEGYTLTVNDTEAGNLEYNPYQKNYDGFEATGIVLNAVDTLKVYTKAGELIAEQSASIGGKYRIIYTPKKTIDGKEYAFDADGNYGSGDEYKYSLYLEEEEEYFIQFYNLTPSADDFIEADGKILYPLARDLEYPNLFQYTTADFFLHEIDQKVEYTLYQRQGEAYEVIDDDSDENVEVSKLKGTYAGWYNLVLNQTANVYASSLRQKTKELSGFYLANEENSYLFDSYGLAAEPEEYRFIELEEDDDLYDEDYTQYRLMYTVTKAMVGKKCYITNGRDFYRNHLEYIQFMSEGTYEILFSEEHLYGRNQNYQYTLKPSAEELIEVAIRNKVDLIDMIKQCNQDSLYSLGKRFYLTNTIDVSGLDLQINAFYGTLDGNYHHLIHLNYTSGEECENYGFIRFLGKQAVLQNISFDNVNIEAKEGKNVGIVGISYGRLQNVAVYGSITGKENTGGLVGYHANYRQEEDDPVTDSSKIYEYGRIIGCQNYARVCGEKSVGGLAGFNGGKIYESENYGKINDIAYSSKKTIENIGGIAGYSTGVIALCQNQGEVGYFGVADYVGGIAGLSTGMFYYDTNAAAVSGLSAVGGIIGCYGSLKEENNNVTEETDLNQHYAGYLTNTAAVSGSNYIGGIAGRITSTGITLKNSISTGSLQAKNGSYLGGIAGQLLNGSIESVLVSGTLAADGTNGGLYVGGIAGYSNGSIVCAFGSTNITGNDYLGGIVGYQTSQAKLISSISNSVLLAKDKNSENVGYVAGKIENLPSDNLKKEFVKYNYFIGDIYGGIGMYTFGREADDAARRMTMEEMLCRDVVSENFLPQFSQNGFIGGTGEYSYPYLRTFEFYEEEEAFDFDYHMEVLFNTYSSAFVKAEDMYARASVLIVFYEWNENSGDIEDIHTYEMIAFQRYYYGEAFDFMPDLVYAENGRYAADDGNYFVRFGEVKDTFISQNIYAQYLRAVSTLAAGDYLLEGEFIEGTEAYVSSLGNTLHVDFIYLGEEIEVKDFILKVKCAGEYTVTADNSSEGIECHRYGEYLAIPVSSSKSTIILTRAEGTSLPVWAAAAISGGVAILICAGAFLLYLRRSKKNKGNIF